jgi:hypothetical protein
MTIRTKNQARIDSTNCAIKAGERNKSAIFSDLRLMIMRCDEMIRPISGYANTCNHDELVAERTSLKAYFDELKAAA